MTWSWASYIVGVASVFAGAPLVLVGWMWFENWRLTRGPRRVVGMRLTSTGRPIRAVGDDDGTQR